MYRYISIFIVGLSLSMSAYGQGLKESTGVRAEAKVDGFDGGSCADVLREKALLNNRIHEAKVSFAQAQANLWFVSEQDGTLVVMNLPIEIQYRIQRGQLKTICTIDSK